MFPFFIITAASRNRDPEPPPKCRHCGKENPITEEDIGCAGGLAIAATVVIGLWISCTLLVWAFDWSVDEQYTLVELFIAPVVGLWHMLHNLW
jgi:hypothetical protein